MHVTPRSITITVGAAAIALALCGSALHAQRGTQQGAFLIRIGNDTIAAEQFTRTPTLLTGDNAIRTPRAYLRHYTAAFDRQGRLTRYEVTVRVPGRPESDPPVQHATMTFRGDTAVVELRTGDSTRTVRAVAGQEVLPLMNYGYASFETIIQRALRMGGDSVVVSTLFMGAPTTNPVGVKRVTRDSLVMDTPFGIVYARVDADGRLLALDSPGSTEQVIVTRVPTLDVNALALHFSQHPLGTLSPRDTVRATFGEAQLLIDYGRPRKRGRVVFGNVVPFDTWWRTGANAATTFVTDHDLVIGGTPVPKGTYTLFSLPSRSGWTLIINKKTGEWGTEYDSTADLAHIDMQVTMRSEPLEQFTITLEPSGNGGTLRLAWDDREASVPIEVR